MRKRFAIAALVFGVFSSNLFAEAPQKIKVGVIIPMSAQFARYGDFIRQGVVAGLGDKAELVFEDEACLPAKAVAAYRKLIDFNRVKYIIGPCCGSSQEAVAPLLKDGHQLVIFPSSAPRDLFASSGGRVLTVQHSIEAESIFNAQRISELGFKRVNILASENQFSESHARAFRQAYKGDLGETLTVPDAQVSNIKSLVLRLKRLKPDAIYVPDVSLFFAKLKTEMAQMGLSKIKVFSIYAVQSPELIEIEAKNAEGLIYSYPRIGENNALTYFPKFAAEIFAKAIADCGEDLECARRVVLREYGMDAYGTLGDTSGDIEWREVGNGKFVVHTP